MKLIGSTTSPYVRKVRVVMAEKKLDYRFVEDNVWADDSTITAANPLGKVPCLVLDGGDAMFDSRVIVEYLDTLSPVGKLIPASGRERAEVKTWEALADGLLDAAILVRLERTFGRPQRSPAQPGLDRPATLQGAGLAPRHEQGPRRKGVLQRHPLHPVGRCRGLRAGLARVSFS